MAFGSLTLTLSADFLKLPIIFFYLMHLTPKPVERVCLHCALSCFGTCAPAVPST